MPIADISSLEAPPKIFSFQTEKGRWAVIALLRDTDGVALHENAFTGIKMVAIREDVLEQMLETARKGPFPIKEVRE